MFLSQTLRESGFSHSHRIASHRIASHHTPCTFDADRSRVDLVENARSYCGFLVKEAYTKSVCGDYSSLSGMAESLAVAAAKRCVRPQGSPAYGEDGGFVSRFALKPASLEAATRFQQRFRG